MTWSTYYSTLTLGSPLKSIPTIVPFPFALIADASCTVCKASAGPYLRFIAAINLGWTNRKG